MPIFSILPNPRSASLSTVSSIIPSLSTSLVIGLLMTTNMAYAKPFNTVNKLSI